MTTTVSIEAVNQARALHNLGDLSGGYAVLAAAGDVYALATSPP